MLVKWGLKSVVFGGLGVSIRVKESGRVDLLV